MWHTEYDYTAQKMKFSIKDFFSKCDQIRSFLRMWPHLLKKSLMENFIFCAVLSLAESSWTYFVLLVSFYTPWKHQKNWFSDVFREYRRTQARWNGLTVTACVTEWLRLGMFRSFKCQTGEFSVFCIIITPFIIINITQLPVLFCNCPLLKDISFNTKCLLVWCD